MWNTFPRGPLTWFPSHAAMTAVFSPSHVCALCWVGTEPRLPQPGHPRVTCYYSSHTYQRPFLPPSSLGGEQILHFWLPFIFPRCSQGPCTRRPPNLRPRAGPDAPMSCLAHHKPETLPRAGAEPAEDVRLLLLQKMAGQSRNGLSCE